MGIFKSLFYTSGMRGKVGEKTIAAKLCWVDIFGKHGLRMNNVYIPLSNGHTTEIDLLYITAKGIFVIESKNYSAYIFGDDEHRMWTCSYYRGKGLLGLTKTEKHQFYNPIWQNRTHIRAIRDYLSIPCPYFSFVVFSDGAELKKVPDPEDTVICHTSGLGAEIRRLWRKNDDALSEREMEKIYEELLPLTHKDRSERKEHIQYVQNSDHNSKRCPRCGAPLVIRTAKKGSMKGRRFYGCSNWPECTYTRNITDNS